MRAPKVRRLSLVITSIALLLPLFFVSETVGSLDLTTKTPAQLHANSSPS